MGTGPFIYSQWQPNDFFTATRNPHYWRSGLPYLDTITFKPIPDTTQRESTLRSGGVDMIESVNPTTITNFTGSGGSGYQLVDTRTGVIGQPSFAFIMLNNAVAPTNDLSIRQALAKAMNQAEVQKIIGGPPAQPANGIFLPDSPYYSKTSYPTYDLSGAKSLVKAYEAKHGTPTLNLLTIPDPLEIKVVQAVQQMWEQAGFKITVSEVEQATIIDDFVLGKFQAVTSYQFGAVNPDLNYVWWSTTTVEPIGTIGLNFSRMNDPAGGRPAPGPPHHQPVHPGVGLQEGQRAAGRATCPTCGSSSTSSPRWPTTGSRTSTRHAAQRQARLQLQRGRILPHSDLVGQLAGRDAR